MTYKTGRIYLMGWNLEPIESKMKFVSPHKKMVEKTIEHGLYKHSPWIEVHFVDRHCNWVMENRDLGWLIYWIPLIAAIGIITDYDILIWIITIPWTTQNVTRRLRNHDWWNGNEMGMVYKPFFCWVSSRYDRTSLCFLCWIHCFGTGKLGKNRTANFDTNAAGIYLHEGKEHIWYIMMYILYNYTLCMAMHVTCIHDSYMGDKTCI